MNSNDIYQVKGQNDHSSYHIAFCKGNPADIKRYFEGEGGYGLYVDLIKVLEITPQSANEKQDLKLKQKVNGTDVWMNLGEVIIQ